METIKNIIQAYAITAFKNRTIYSITHTYGNYYMVDMGMVTAYFTVIDGKIIDVMID